MTIKIEVTPAEANLILQACENSSDQWAFRLLDGKIVRATLKDPADDDPEVEILRYGRELVENYLQNVRDKGQDRW